jgi:hypothetical protein
VRIALQYFQLSGGGSFARFMQPNLCNQPMNNRVFGWEFPER